MGSVAILRVQPEFERISKLELHELADNLLLEPDPSVVDRSVRFVLAETRGLWHGRGRAMLCRRLKHCSLGRTHRTQLLSCITHRLSSGVFSEQFKDQLRLAMHLDREKVIAVSAKCVNSPSAHVRRYANWLLAHGAPRNAS